MISTDYSKSEEMAKDMFKTVDNIVMHVKETQDDFIFSTLSKCAPTNYNSKVDKRELIMAIEFIRMCNETGTDLRQYHNTASNETELYRKGYDMGFKAGVQEVCNRLKEEIINDY